MRPNRPAVALCRIVLAALFGFMSLGHGPLMTFSHAHGAPLPHSQVAQHHEHGHHEPTSSRAEASLPEQAPACYAVGCFISLAALPIGEPPATLVPLARLLPLA